MSGRLRCCAGWLLMSHFRDWVWHVRVTSLGMLGGQCSVAEIHALPCHLPLFHMLTLSQIPPYHVMTI